MPQNMDWTTIGTATPDAVELQPFTVEWNGTTYVLAESLQYKLADYSIYISDDFFSFYQDNSDQIRIFDPEKDVDLFGDVTVDIASEQQCRNTDYEEPIFDSDERCIVPVCMIMYKEEMWMMLRSIEDEFWGYDGTLEDFLSCNEPEIRKYDQAIDGEKA